MFGFTMSTPLDMTYRFSPELNIGPGDEGAAVYRWSASAAPEFVGTVINGALRGPLPHGATLSGTAHKGE